MNDNLPFDSTIIILWYEKIPNKKHTQIYKHLYYSIKFNNLFLIIFNFVTNPN